MKNYIIIHDKLINFGGAEVVLASLVNYRKPKAIICSCVSDRQKWEKIYGVRIFTPVLTGFITNPLTYKFFYPYIILACYLSSLALSYKNTFFVVYSSSAGKYFRLREYNHALLYVNYHAKGIRNAKSYIANNRFLLFADRVIQTISSLFLFLEDKMVFKFIYIRAISLQALKTLPNTVGGSGVHNIGIMHCPASLKSFPQIAANPIRSPFVDFYVLVSRLTPEKNLKPLLDYLYFNSFVNLVIIGEGPLLKNYVRDYPQRFFFTGFVDAGVKNTIISSSLGLIQPTSQEWSLVAIEANMLGVPAIVARSSAIEEINFTISGRTDTPNILFTNFSELLVAFEKILTSRIYINNNLHKINDVFSEELFHTHLLEIEDQMFRKKSEFVNVHNY